MGRLIDTDAFKKQVAGMAISGNCPVDKANVLCELIDIQPTAYDPDKVVEQIKELSIREFGEIKTEDVIAIVRGGGADG